MSTRFLHLIELPSPGANVEVQIARREFSFAMLILKNIGPACWLDSFLIKRLRRDATRAADKAATVLTTHQVPATKWEVEQ